MNIDGLGYPYRIVVPAGRIAAMSDEQKRRASAWVRANSGDSDLSVICAYGADLVMWTRTRAGATMLRVIAEHGPEGVDRFLALHAAGDREDNQHDQRDEKNSPQHELHVSERRET